MKIMHVHAKSSRNVTIPDDKLAMLPKLKWGVFTTIQHREKIRPVIDQLRTAQLAGQVLGCNASEVEKITDQVDAFLFVGSGVFHPVQVAMVTKKPVWLWNPMMGELKKLDETLINKWEAEKNSQLTGFLAAKKVGIIVSTKMGQKNLMRAVELAKNADREYFLFACDTIDTREFENFNFIDFWVNTSCPRFTDEKTKMVNIGELIDAGVLDLEKDTVAYEVPIWMSRLEK